MFPSPSGRELYGALLDKLVKSVTAALASEIGPDTSSITAKDTFAWTEYDHENFDKYPDHIIYDGDSIKMLGYTKMPYKDFLFVDEKESEYRILEFDMQRDKTDWHSMEGGGFLFNTYIQQSFKKFTEILLFLVITNLVWL